MPLQRGLNLLSPNWLIPCLVIFSFLLVACGGGSSDSDASAQNQNPPPPTENKNFSGVVQKGPFAPDSILQVTRLSTTGQVTDDVFTTSTYGAEGNYSFDMPESWEGNNVYLELSATGRFLDETSGIISNNPITLKALLSSQAQANSSINLLTHWSAIRVKVLIHQEHLSFTDALKQADAELKAITGIGNSNRLDISQNQMNIHDSAQLLLLSGALLELSRGYGVTQQEIINQIGADFAQDGVLNGLGKNWLKRVQSTIGNNPHDRINLYSHNINKNSGSLVRKAPSAYSLPQRIAIAGNPQAIAPEVIYAQPSEKVILDGSASHDSGNIINTTWFRIDQQEQFVVPLSNRFLDSPTIIAPNQECELLFALIVTDEEKLTDTTVVKVIVKITEEPDGSPVANSQSVVTFEDTPIDITISGNDPDGDDLSFDVGDTPLLLRHGILEGEAPNLKYTPAQDYFGEDSFDFTVSDSISTSDKATVDITIIPVNDKPIADSQSVSTNENTAISIGLTGADIENDPLSFNIVNPALNGSLDTSALPEVIYTPNTNYTGSDQFTFVANDGTDLSEPAVVDIIVLPVNGKPVAITQSLETPQETPINIFLTGEDIDGDPLEFTLITTTNNGSLSGIAPNLIYRPNLGFIGLDSFIFKVNDGLLDSNNASVSIRVTPETKNSVPIANPLSLITEVNSPLDISLMGTDADGDSLRYILLSIPDNGGLIGRAPNLIYQPDTDYVGSDSFFYAVSDGKAQSSLALVDISIISNENNPPKANAGPDQTVIVNPAGSTSNTTQTVTLSGSGIDTDGSIEQYKWIQLSGLTVSLSNDESTNPEFTTPPVALDTTEILVFQLAVTDDLGASDTDEVMITVNLNAAPVADAGEDTEVNQGDFVTLNGSNSFDVDGPELEDYQWTAPPGIELINATSVNPTFTAPIVSSTPETFVFSLVVTDSLDLPSAEDTVAITVTPSTNLPPTAIIHGPDSVFVNEIIKLDGGESSDDDGEIVSYDWVGPMGETDSGVTVGFSAPSVPGTVTVQLTVADDDGAVNTTSKSISVNPIGIPPVADAGEDITEEFNGEVNFITLDGTDSFDPDGLTDGSDLTYFWRAITEEIPINLRNADTPTPSFNISFPATIELELTVTDASGLTDSDRVTVTITERERDPANNIPIVKPIPVNTNLNAGSTLPLDGFDDKTVDTVIVVNSSISTSLNGLLILSGSSYIYTPD